MNLLEVVRGAATATNVLATGMAIARRIGKVPVVSGVGNGFIGNRMLIPRRANAGPRRYAPALGADLTISPLLAKCAEQGCALDK